jgi:hypothetical protein
VLQNLVGRDVGYATLRMKIMAGDDDTCKHRSPPCMHHRGVSTPTSPTGRCLQQKHRSGCPVGNCGIYEAVSFFFLLEIIAFGVTNLVSGSARCCCCSV